MQRLRAQIIGTGGFAVQVIGAGLAVLMPDARSIGISLIILGALPLAFVLFQWLTGKFKNDPEPSSPGYPGVNEAPISVTSHGQTGGVTAGIINNFKPPQRHFSPAMLREFRAICDRSVAVSIGYAMGDQEAAMFAQELSDALRQDGQKFSIMPSPAASVYERPPEPGLRYSFSDDRSHIDITVGPNPD